MHAWQVRVAVAVLVEILEGRHMLHATLLHNNIAARVSQNVVTTHYIMIIVVSIIETKSYNMHDCSFSATMYPIFAASHQFESLFMVLPNYRKYAKHKNGNCRKTSHSLFSCQFESKALCALLLRNEASCTAGIVAAQRSHAT